MLERTRKGKLYQSLKQNISDSSEQDDNDDEDDDELAIFERRLPNQDFEMFSTLEPNETYHSDDNIQFIDGKPLNYSLSQIVLIGLLILLLLVVLVGHYWTGTRTLVTEKSIWSKEIPKLELIRQLKYFPNNQNLILIYENSKWDIIRDSGLISINLNSSNQTWYYRFMQNQLPQIVNCSLADFNGDNQTDCLIFHDNGLLQVLDSNDGSLLWSLAAQMPFFLKKISFPILLHDISNDRIIDLILVVNYKRIVIIDGQNGELLLDPIDINECYVIKQLKVLPKSNYFEYYCDEDLEPKQFNYESVWHLDSTLPKPIDFNSEIKNEEKLANLTYKTIGSCGNYSYNCSVNYRLENLQNETIWSLNLTNSFSMRPIIFMSTASSGIQNIFLKFWTFSRHEQTKNFNVNYFNESILFLEIFRKYLKIDFRVRTILTTEIMQLCKTINVRNECQPELFFFKDSLLFNGQTMDVFSFTTTYQKVNNRSDFQLFSKVTRIQLLH